MQVRLQRLSHGLDLPLPMRASQGSAGYDLMAAVKEPLLLKPLARLLIPTGIAIALPDGFEAQIRPRSGLAYKKGITVLNSPGTIDSDYRGEIKVLAINFGEQIFKIEHAMCVAQMVIARFEAPIWQVSEHLDETERGVGGFGSTGMKR
ncbi:MAG: dUTP diphosphatase [Pseudomonadota bacterium]